MSKKTQAAVADPVEERPAEPRRKEKPPQARKQPKYNVILWDDDDHTYEYVIRMMRQLFGHSIEHSFEIATEVDHTGRAICLTTTMEHAELKRDQVHAFGRDALISRCKGSMYCTIEPVT